MRRTVSIIAGMLMLSGVAFAKEIILDEAINLATQNNSSIISLNAEQRQQESDYKKVKKNTQIWQNKQAYGFDTAEEYFLYT